MDSTLSPLDERYFNKTKDLRQYFSEMAFFKYRFYVEIRYFINLIDALPELKLLMKDKKKIDQTLMGYYYCFDNNYYKFVNHRNQKK